MITAGVDVGAKLVKVVILKDGQILSQAEALTGHKKEASARQAFDEGLRRVSLSKSNIERIVATGEGRERVSFADEYVTVVEPDARGAFWHFPSMRTVIDVGAEEVRVIRCGPGGKVTDFVTNERCAAGAGTFVEVMARTLEVNLEDMGKISLRSQKEVPMNAQCVVFAESEVVSLIHSRTAVEDIARAIHEAIASRIMSLINTVGRENDVALIGGMAMNIGFVDAMKRQLGVELLIPDSPKFIGALGASLIGSS